MQNNPEINWISLEIGNSTTIILVGVAENISELIENHNSIDRALIQIPLNRMQDNELREIISSRIDKTQMEFEVDAVWTIIKLSKGLPYFTHPFETCSFECNRKQASHSNQ